MFTAEFSIDESRAELTITFRTTPPAVLKLDAAALEGFIGSLGHLRTSLEPQPVAYWPPGKAVEAISNPPWTTEPEAMKGESLLHIRDPRYGWLHYVFPRDEARKLGESLQAQANLPPQGPPSGKAS